MTTTKTTKTTKNRYTFTKADQPKPQLEVFWTLGGGRTTQPLRLDVNAPVQVVTDYLRTVQDPNIGEVQAGWTFLAAVMPPEDYDALAEWLMDYDQLQLVGKRAFQCLARGTTDDPDNEG